MAWNAVHNPGTHWANRPCDCDCHWTEAEWNAVRQLEPDEEAQALQGFQPLP